jgi:hypothetical protein
VIEMDFVEPPPDPNEWTDEQWLEWLMATDDAPLAETEETVPFVVKHIVQSTPGQVIGQAMLGMAQAIYGRQDDEIIIVVGANGEGAEDEPFTVRIDFDHPERSSVEFKEDSSPAK